MPITAAKAPKILPDLAKEIYASAFNASGGGVDASKIAWGAVKSKFQKDEKGAWIPKSVDQELSELSLYISKASFDKKTGEMRWAAVASDTEEDLTEEYMSLDLFKDFIQRAESGEEVPEEFKSEYWSGGMPYVSVSHYPDCNGVASAGVCQALYVDGNRLKAKGIFTDSDLGRACFKSVCESLYAQPDMEKKVRISIGFLDWSHSHGDSNIFDRKSLTDFCMSCVMKSFGVDIGKKKYLKGQLIHLALTREPANPRTDITEQMEVIKSMTTQKSDAESIIGEELAEKIEEEAKKFVGKSMAFVVKTDADGELDATDQVDEDEAPVEEVPEAPVEEKAMAKGDKKGKKEDMDEEDMDEEDETKKACKKEKKSLTEDGVLEKTLEVLTKMEAALNKPVPEPAPVHPLDESITKIKEIFDTVSSNKSLSKDEKLGAMQESFDGLGQVLKASFGEEVPEVVGTSTVAVQPSLDVETLKTAFQEAMQPLAESVKLLLQYSSAPNSDQISRQDKTPVRRSLVGTPFTGELTKAPSVTGSVTPKLREIVNRSVYTNR